MYYITERLQLLVLQKEDFPEAFSVFSNPQTMTYTLLDRYITEESFQPYFQELLENPDLQGYLLRQRTDNVCVGFANIEFSNRSQNGGTGEIGYFLLPEFWGNGYATEVATALCTIGFCEYQLHRMCASCNANNLHSEHIMQKIGMQKEGCLRKARLKEDSWTDELKYSVLQEEWDP